MNIALLAFDLDGTTITQLDKMVPFAQFNELMGLQKIRDIEHTYASSTGR
mgnify:CR=1 FL=1